MSEAASKDLPAENEEEDEEDEEDQYDYRQKILELQREVDSLKAKNKSLELKKKESDLGLNKIKTEINSLRSLDKQWKDAARTVCVNIQDMKVLYDAQIDQMFEGWKSVVKTSERIQKRSKNLKDVQSVIQQLQQKIAAQGETIAGLNVRISALTAELDDKTKKIERLSEGIEEEVDRLCQPMRDKLAESMVMIMREKSLRAQERRELADLWPIDVPMPSLLMKYRSLNECEQSSRTEITRQKDATLALSLEIRSNVAEAQSWEIQYDDYGRPFYQHRKTGQISEEAPEILQYKPPDGWDENGNIIQTAENDTSNWIMETDHRGQVFYKNSQSGEISWSPPNVYDKIPIGKTREATVAEAASIVLDYIKEKIVKHMWIKNRRKEELENPLTPEERRKKEKILKNRTAEEIAASGDNITEEGELIELSKYQYDIETVEMLAFDLVPSSTRQDDEDIEEIRKLRRSFLSNCAVRNFREDLLDGKRLLELDESELTIDNIRKIVESIAESEEHLEKKLDRARQLLQEYSFLLMEKSAEQDSNKIAELVEERKQIERDRKLAEKMLLVEKRQKGVSKVKTNDAQDVDISSPSSKSSRLKDKEQGKSLKSGKKKEKNGDEILSNYETQDSGGDEVTASLKVKDIGKSQKSVKKKQKENESILPIDEAHESGDEEPKEEDAIDQTFVVDMEEIENIVFGDPALRLFGEASPPSEGLIVDTELQNICRNLSNFSFFCGYMNLNPSEYPLQSTITSSIAIGAGDAKYSKDDRWLSCHFFLSLTQNTIADSKSDMHQLLSNYLTRKDEPVADKEQKSSKSYRQSFTPITRAITERSIIEESYKLWKSQLQFDDIIRWHLQRHAICIAQQNSSSAFLTPKPIEILHHIPYVQLTVSNICFSSAEVITAVGQEELFVRMSLKEWSSISPGIFKSPFLMRWVEFCFTGNVNINDINLEDLEVSLLLNKLKTEDASTELKVIGKAKQNLSIVLDGNIGRTFTFSLAIEKVSKEESRGNQEVLGQLSFDICSNLFTRVEERQKDWRESKVMKMLKPVKQEYDEKLVRTSSSLKTKIQCGHESVKDKMRLLVAELRGDNWTLARKLSAGVDMQFSESNFATISDIDDAYLQKLPNFEHSTIFLQRKLRMHRSEVRAILKEIESKSTQLLDDFKTRKEKLSKDLQESKSKQRKLADQVEELKKEVVRVTKGVVDLRKPNVEPKEPNFPLFDAIPYVPSVPTIGSLDSRGKKKKVLSPADIKSILDSIDNGTLDGAETLSFPENSFPSQAQQLKISKAAQQRNELLDGIRQQEQQARDRTMEMYRADKERWDSAEKRRLAELEKAKKDCRKINLKFDSATLRLQRFEEENSGIEIDIKSIQDLAILQQNSILRFKQARLKQSMELKRQEDFIASLRNRLFKCLLQRRSAIDFPSTARTIVEYQEFKQKSENLLVELKLELFEARQASLQEGVRFRCLLREEKELLRAELMRVNVSLEILNQRGSFDSILQKFKFDCSNLLSDLERLKLREADKDDVGLETFDDWGERYLPTKVWSNPDIQKCQRMMDLTIAKSKSTEGFSRSASESQRVVIDCLSNQFGEVYFTTRDSWTERSDYERAQQLLMDTIHYLNLMRRLLDAERQQLVKPIHHHTMEGEMRTVQFHRAIEVHEQESFGLRFSVMGILDEMKRREEENSLRTKARVVALEQSIVDLSRECQKVREELVAQQLAFDEKTKILWAFIHTLQTSIQQMSAKMEILVEERDKIVIQAKLMADSTRHQLRIERKHSSNLSFIIHSQRGSIRYLKDIIKKITADNQKIQSEQNSEKLQLRRDVWENVFTFTRLCTDVDALFEFFASRLANLAGARYNLNDALAKNNAAIVLAALCRNPRAIIRRYAARALGGMGWNGFTEMRVLLWDSMMFWKMLKSKVLQEEAKEFNDSLSVFATNGKFDAILRMKNEIEEFAPTGNSSLRSIIKQRRQWALRAARRVEGPNVSNQKLLNVRDKVLTSLLEICLEDGAVDWEISRNAALTVSIASFEIANHAEMMESDLCVSMILQMCRAPDAEVQTHAAVTIANLCHKDIHAQEIFGDRGAIPVLLSMLDNPVSDVLEGSSAALANLTCYCDKNCQQVLEANGVKKVVHVMTSAYSENLLDFDQNDEVQANAAEMLANVSRFSTQESIRYFDGHCIDALVVMCASNNKQLKRNVSLVMGNIAQAERCRHEIGMRGGIEALFLATEDTDVIVQANALWALTNLMWYPPNQERAGRFTTEVVSFMRSENEPVKVNACVLAGNLLYYNTTNRVRFLETEGALEMVMKTVAAKTHVVIVEALLRVLLSLTYIDSIAMWVGVDGGFIPLFLSFLMPPFFSRGSMRYSLEILCNLCLHHANRQIIHNSNGIELIVPLHADVDPHIRTLSVEIIEHLEDITPPEVLARIRKNVGLERMISLAVASTDPLVKAVAAESIGEEIWSAAAASKNLVDSSQNLQDRTLELGGIDALLAMLLREEEEVAVVLPALWSLRNLLHRHYGAQQQFGVHRDGIVLVTQILRRCWKGLFGKQVEKVLEASLACLINAVQGHDKNARRLVLSGLDAILAITNKDDTLDVHLQAALHSEGVQVLAKTILISLGPYNYIVCSNCSKRQELHGMSCVACGHRLLVEIDEGILQARKDRRVMQSSQSVNRDKEKMLHGTTWKHAGIAKNSSPVVEEFKTLPPQLHFQVHGATTMQPNKLDPINAMAENGNRLPPQGGGLVHSRTAPALLPHQSRPMNGPSKDLF
jgi:hypothetical protein